MRKIAYTLFALLTPFLLCAQSSTLLGKSKVQENYSWPSPSANDMVFQFVAMDGKARRFYVAINDFYVPIRTAGRNSLGSAYVLPKSKLIKLCERRIEDGKEFFDPIATIDTKGFTDFIAGIFPSGEGLKTSVVDISLDAMPVGSMNIVNLQPYQLGIKISGNTSSLKMFGHMSKNLRNSQGRFLTEFPIFYDLRDPKRPKVFYSRQFRFAKDTRSILYVMGLRKGDNEIIDMQQFVSVCDSGPRT